MQKCAYKIAKKVKGKCNGNRQIPDMLAIPVQNKEINNRIQKNRTQCEINIKNTGVHAKDNIFWTQS